VVKTTAKIKKNEAKNRINTLEAITRILGEMQVKAGVLEDVFCSSQEADLTNEEWGMLDRLTSDIAKTAIEFRTLYRAAAGQKG